MKQINGKTSSWIKLKADLFGESQFHFKMTDNSRVGRCSICSESGQTDQPEVPTDTKETFFRHGLGLFCSPGNDCNYSYYKIRGLSRN